MPWSIKTINQKYCVVKQGENAPIPGGCHTDQKEAADHLKSLYASEGQLAIDNFNSMNGGDYVPKPGLPLQHVETMKEVIHSLKRLTELIVQQHFVSADLPSMDQKPADVAPIATYEYATEALATGEKVEEYHWEGPVAFEGVLTGDNRYFKAGSIEWDAASLPVPFRFQKSSTPGHAGAVPIGRVDRLERKEDGSIYGYGVVIPSLNDEAAEYLRLLESGVAGGVSVDGDSAVFEVQELADGKTRVEFSSMRLRSVTSVDIPAFSDAQVDLVEEGDIEELARKKRKKAMKWVYSLTASGDHGFSKPLWLEENEDLEVSGCYEVSSTQYGIINICETHAVDAKNLPSLSPEVFATLVTNTFNTTISSLTDSALIAKRSSLKTTEKFGVAVAGKTNRSESIKKLMCGCEATLVGWNAPEKRPEFDMPELERRVNEPPITKLNGGIVQKRDKSSLQRKETVVQSAVNQLTILKDEEQLKTPTKTIVILKTNSEISYALLAIDPWEVSKTILNSFTVPWNILRDMNAVVASAIPVKPPTEWFEDPNFSDIVPITVTKEGRVSGYMATWSSCHIGFPGACVSPPKNGSYKYFHTGEIETDKGDLVEVGHLTFNTGHAAMNDTAKATAAHYDNTGTVAADVRVGEDKFGIWVAGALRSHLEDADVRAFRAAPLSGDWRRIAGKLELVAALAVNVPGFPVPRVRTLVASGVTETLITFQEADIEARQDRKLELAQRVFTFQGDDLTPMTKSEIEAIAKTATKSDLVGYLKDLKDLLDDPEEFIEDKDRSQLTEFYKMVSDKLSSATSASAETEEFFNKAHSKSSGRFISSGGGGGKGRKGGGTPSPEGSQVAALGNSRDPLNQHAKTAREADSKYKQSKISARKWAGVAVAGAVAPLFLPIVGVGSTLVLGTGITVSAVRYTQARRHLKQRDALLKNPNLSVDTEPISSQSVELASYQVKSQFGKYCVADSKGIIIKGGCYATKEQAAAKLKALGAASITGTVELANNVTKSEGDAGNFPASDYAYTPDPDKSSTWKLRLTSTPGGSPDPGIVGAAVAALGKGFRGNKVMIPSADLAAVKAKVRAAWLKADPSRKEADVPAVLK